MLFTDTEETTEAPTDQLQDNDLQTTASASPSPNSDAEQSNDRKIQPPRIRSVEKINSTQSQLQLQEIDVEHNIPASFIPDTNNVHADRYVKRKFISLRKNC